MKNRRQPSLWDEEHNTNRSAASVVLEICAAVCVFAAVVICIIVWRPGRSGWAFLTHFLVIFSLGLWLFSERLGRRRPRLPSSAPEMSLLLLAIYGVANVAMAGVPRPALERLPFLMDGMILFYLGTTLFRRRFEAFTLLFLLSTAGIIMISRQAGVRLPWDVDFSLPALYRGRRLLLAAISDHVFTGCGMGGIGEMFYRYLPAPGRHPPALRNGYGVLIAEHGIIGGGIWMCFIASLAGYLVRKRKKDAPPKLSRKICFYVLTAGILILLIAGFFYVFPVTPAGFLVLTSVSGAAMSLRRDLREKPDITKKISYSFAIIVIAPLLVLLAAVGIQPAAEALAGSVKPEELGSKKAERRLKISRILFPCNAKTHLKLAKHKRGLAQSDNYSLLLSIESSYLNAIRWNPFNDQYYMEYGHFLNMKGDYSRMVNRLEKGVENCPGSVELRLLLYRGYMNTGNRRAALDILWSLKKFYPLDFATQLRLSRYYAEAGSREDRLALDALAMQIHPVFTGGKSQDRHTSGEDRKSNRR